VGGHVARMGEMRVLVGSHYEELGMDRRIILNGS
jgi:hypothetical protein